MLKAPEVGLSSAAGVSPSSCQGNHFASMIVRTVEWNFCTLPNTPVQLVPQFRFCQQIPTGINNIYMYIRARGLYLRFAGYHYVIRITDTAHGEYYM